MIEEEVSHIEIIEEVIDDAPKAVVAAPVYKTLFDVAGWKKDAKKIGLILLLVLLLWGFYAGIMKIKDGSDWGIRFHAPVEKVRYQTYGPSGAKFTFAYPEKYVFDADVQKKFGTDYLAGFHLDADSRTGCDVRASEVGINFAKSDQEIAAAISQELAANVKGFDKFAGERIKVDDKDAFKSSFSLTDPLGNKLRITQVLVSPANQENYLLVCGSGEAQAEFFTQDFSDFLHSFRFKA